MTCISVHQNDQKSTNIRFWRLKSIRLQLGLLLCMNFFVLAYMRHSLGMAMVCMVNSTAVGMLDSEYPNVRLNLTDSDNGQCPVTTQLRHDYEGKFVWSTGQQGMLFAAIYWGSLTSFPAGWIADRYSSKRVLTLALLINAIGSALTPISAEYGGYAALFVVRCFMGAGQGLLVPAVSAFISRWIPPNERSTVISLYTAGNQLASLVGMPIGARLCQAKYAFGGWPLIFYSASTLGFVCSLVWTMCVTNCPEKNARLAPSEREFILSSIQMQPKKQITTIPWRSLITSKPVWACILCNFADGVLTATLSSYLPTYFMEILHLGLFANGIYSAAPYFVQASLKFVMAAIADKLKSSERISATGISKIFNSIGHFGPSIFLISCSFLTCQHGALAIGFLCLAMGLSAGTAPGFMTSQVTLAPTYAGTVSAATTVAFQIGAIVAPYFVGAITTHGTKQEWQIVFAAISILLVMAGLVYLGFGSGDTQPWSKCSPIPTQRQISIPDVAVVAMISDHNHSTTDAMTNLDILLSAVNSSSR